MKRLKQARISSGLTQVEAGKKLGRPHSFVSKCEMGERRVDIVELLRFSRIYGKSPSFFFRELSPDRF